LIFSKQVEEMDRADFVSSFSKRLNSLLQKEGYSSNRSKAGIEIGELAKVAGVSYQMARKYALGLALPNYHVIPKIAKWLNVSPSLLLFGEKEPITPEHKSHSLIEIESDLLKYILLKCTVLFPPVNKTEQIINYIVGVIYDASHINADSKTILKIIDMMLSSAIQLSEIKKEKRA
jgi:transcriptional regulator with XRE-family HTH domain